MRRAQMKEAPVPFVGFADKVYACLERAGCHRRMGRFQVARPGAGQRPARQAAGVQLALERAGIEFVGTPLDRPGIRCSNLLNWRGFEVAKVNFRAPQ